MLGLSAVIPLAGVVALGQKTNAPSPGAPESGDLLSRLTQADFTRYLRTMFSIRMTAKIAWKVELYQVVENKAGTTQGLQNFSLFFRGSHDNHLRQNTYNFEHPQLGAFSLFISPAGSSGSMKQYEAVFNRL
jgi:hypothetical protein